MQSLKEKEGKSKELELWRKKGVFLVIISTKIHEVSRRPLYGTVDDLATSGGQLVCGR